MTHSTIRSHRFSGGNGQTGSLNTLAQGFASTVNTLLTSGTTSSGSPGVPVFTYDNVNPSNVAASLAVDPSVTAEQLAVASTGASSSSNGVSNQLAGLVNSNSAANRIGGLSRRTITRVSRNRWGNSCPMQPTKSTSDQTSLTSAQANQTSVEGVSLDQEAVNITADQRAWEAAAKLVTVMDNLTLDSVNLVGEQDS